MQLTINNYRQLFADKICFLTIPWLLVKSLTFPWLLSNSLTFPGFPDKLSPCVAGYIRRWFTRPFAQHIDRRQHNTTKRNRHISSLWFYDESWILYFSVSLLYCDLPVMCEFYMAMVVCSAWRKSTILKIAQVKKHYFYRKVITILIEMMMMMIDDWWLMMIDDDWWLMTMIDDDDWWWLMIDDDDDGDDDDDDGSYSCNLSAAMLLFKLATTKVGFVCLSLCSI